jgi:1,2-phenylacetyl-CoA epoxidase PaaB subunit
MNTPALKEWPLWEVFVRSKQGLEHKHCGSLHAADAAAGPADGARRVHPPPGRREHLGGALGAITASAQTTRASSSTPRPTRSTATRPSTTSPTKWGTCDEHAGQLPAAPGRQRRGAGPAQRRMVRSRPCAGRRHGAGQHQPGPDRPGAPAVPARRQLKAAATPPRTAGLFPRCARVPQLHAAGVAAPRRAGGYAAADRDYATTIVRNFLYSALMVHVWERPAAVRRRQPGGHRRQIAQGNQLPPAPLA